MPPIVRSLALVVMTGAMLGCPMSQNGMRNIRSLPTSTQGAGAAQTAQRPGEDPQTAYRRELLSNQLRHARMDLQAATNEAERQSIQQRIDTIQQVMASLDSRF